MDSFKLKMQCRFFPKTDRNRTDHTKSRTVTTPCITADVQYSSALFTKSSLHYTFVPKLMLTVLTFAGEQEIPGLTDTTIPRRLGPKRASKIRKLFNLKKEDDVRQYVVRRPLPAKEGSLLCAVLLYQSMRLIYRALCM